LSNPAGERLRNRLIYTISALSGCRPLSSLFSDAGPLRNVANVIATCSHARVERQGIHKIVTHMQTYATTTSVVKRTRSAI
jgi:hypothetical protein